MSAFDVIVVGAGVAGAAAALQFLSTGWRVALISRGEDAAGIETLSPAAVEGLDRLNIGVGQPLDEIVAWWGSDCESKLDVGGARIVDRLRLAEALRNKASAFGGLIFEATAPLRITQLGQRWLLRCCASSGTEYRIIAPYLVDATGRSAMVGRIMGGRREMVDRLSSLSVSLRDPGVVGTWTESVPNGWWNLTCLPGEGTLSFYSSAAEIRNIRQDFARHFRRTRHLHDLIPAPMFQSLRARSCSSSRLVPTAGLQWVAVGDASMAMQPLASAGVARALRDARRCRSALERPPLELDRLIAREFESYLRTLSKHYFLERRWRLEPFWQATSSPITRASKVRQLARGSES
jgi:flavin-dependent dehydrogenase